MDSVQVIKDRIDELIKEREQFFAETNARMVEANARMLAYDTVIGEMSKLLDKIANNNDKNMETAL